MKFSKKFLGMAASIGVLGFVTACGATAPSGTSSTGASTASTSGSSSTSSQSSAFKPGSRPRGGAGFMNPAGLAKVLGISATTLQNDLKANESLVQIASSKGISEATLIKDVESSFKTQLDSRVKAGKMTAAQETQMLSRYDANVKTMVERKGLPQRPAGFGNHGNQTSNNVTANQAGS